MISPAAARSGPPEWWGRKATAQPATAPTTDPGIRVGPKGTYFVRRGDTDVRAYAASGEIELDEMTRAAVLKNWDRF